MSKLDELKTLYAKMKQLKESEMVFGDGNPDGGILFIGEAPGKEEIFQLKPFVGKAGKNLDEFLKTISLSRETAYITNAVKFRPTSISNKNNIVNRTPNTEEVLLFRPSLLEEIKTINPSLIVTLGATPLKSILNDFSLSISNYHGKETFVNVVNCNVFPLYHPAAIIYNAGLKETYQKDLELLDIILRNENFTFSEI